MAAGMRARLIRNVSIQIRLVNSRMVVIKRWSDDVIVVCPIGRTRQYPICRIQQKIPAYGPSVQVKILQFQMLAGYACTVHGSQGCSYRIVWIDMAIFFATAHAYVALSRAWSLQGLYILNYRREAFLVDPYYVQLWNWFVATNVLAPKPVQHIPPYPRTTFTSTLVARIMCVCRSWHTKCHSSKRLDARILKLNMLLILQYMCLQWWYYIDRQLQGDKLSLDIADLNEDGKEQPRMRGRATGTSQQPNDGVQLLDGYNKPHLFSADVLSQMSVVQLQTLCAAHGLSTSGTKTVFRERILRKPDDIEGQTKRYPTKLHVFPPPSSSGDHPNLDARNCHFTIEYWPDQRNGSIEHNVHLAECAWLSTLPVQCFLEVLLPPGTTSVKPVMIHMPLAQLMPHFPTLSLICMEKCALPLLLTSRNSTIGVHYVLTTDLEVDRNSLVIHDSKDASSECGAMF